MIETLHTSAHFPTSGATLTGDFQPQTGITAVVGENGAGKTFLTIETVRWLLFGKAALRGAAVDYKQAEAVGTFVIRGARYEISRGKHEWMKDASGATIAKGAEKVTEKAVELLGYDREVFDLCNAATQGQVQKLGDMRPAERKAIVDKVLRLTEAEAAEKACRAEALGYRRDADTMVKLLRSPGDKPVEPPHYLPSASAQSRLQELRRLRNEHSALRGRLRALAAPNRPTVATFSEDAIAELQQYVDEQRDLHNRHRNLTVAASGADWSSEQLDAAEARLEVAGLIRARGPRPTMTPEAVAEQWQLHHAFDAYEASDEVTCPKCAHTFRPTGEPPRKPDVAKVDLREEDTRRQRWPDDGPAIPDGLDLTTRQIATGRAALAAREELAALPPLGPDRQGELNIMRQDKAAVEAFAMAQLQYERARQANAEIEAQIARLQPEPSEAGLDALLDEYQAARAYEVALDSWTRDDAAFKEMQAKVAEANRLADEYKRGAQGVADARAVVKALIAPKISRIATVLIRDMSLGKLDNLVVDNEMEITVGGQRIETLSGAGKTVANLALRVAMGQALVGHVFPVFLADEIDGDLSVKRREATLQALVSLKKHLSQIILVTHRGADIADHVIRVGNE